MRGPLVLNRCTMATVLGCKVEIPVCSRKLKMSSLVPGGEIRGGFMAEEKQFAGDGLSRREVMARTAWAGLGATAGLVGAGELEKLWAQMAPRVDESSPRIFGASVEKLPPIDDRY